MKALAGLLSAALAAQLAQAEAGPNPISKVLQLITDLQAKVISEGEESQKLYEEYAQFCERRSKDLSFEIRTGKSEASKLEAAISKDTALIGSFNAKIEELSASIATNEADLRAAKLVRQKENENFISEEGELSEVTGALERAIGILERELQKGGGAALLQEVKNMGSVAQAFETMVQASALSSSDGARLTALVQSSQQSADEDEDASFGAPAAAAYESHSNDIIETLDGLLQKAQAQLAEVRKTEMSNKANYELMDQSLKDEMAASTQDLDACKKGLAESGERKAVAEGDLTVTTKDVKADVETLSALHQSCMSKAEDFETATTERNEELKALATAKQAIKEATGKAEDLAYGSAAASASFLQLGGHRSNPNDLAKTVRMLRMIARKQRSTRLAQLAVRMGVSVRSAARDGVDPFKKVRSLISDMLTRLQDEAEADASQKAHCDKELAETKAEKEDKTTEIEKLTTRVDKMTVMSAQLKEEVAGLQKALSELASSQAEMDKLRQEENADYVKNKATAEKGLSGVKVGLKVLREYYASSEDGSSGGAGGGIIGLLEVVESDLSKQLAGITTTEDSAASTYKKETQENRVERAAKEEDVKAKTKEAASLDKTVAEATTDRSAVQAQLDAVNEYSASLNKQCIAQPESYAQRKARRDAELEGLKEALSALEGKAMLVQRSDKVALRR